MNKIIPNPYLPDTKVKSVYISGINNKIIQSLNGLNIDTLLVKPNNNLSYEISTHADCHYSALTDSMVFVDESNIDNIVNFFTNNQINAKVIKETIESPYPDDIKLNFRVIGKNVICNSDYLSCNVRNVFKENNFNIIHSNQGYAACSTVVINDNALITDDESIYKSCCSTDIDTLLISKGSVKLEGFEYGFIGGCCGFLDSELLAFTGHINSHTDGKKIIDFLTKYSVSYIELQEGPLLDIGGIIPLF